MLLFPDQGDSTLKFEVALGYRDATQGPWKRMVTGNVTRTLSCGYHKELKVSLLTLVDTGTYISIS